jgi:hypothetical protein
MKTKKRQIIIFLSLVSIFMYTSCDKNGDDVDIVHKTVNKNYILTPDISVMYDNDTIIAHHIDSILNGLIDTELISTGYIRFDIDEDLVSDFAFEIINLQAFNNNSLPEEFDSLAVRTYPLSGEILDNSTYRYADALDDDTDISSTGNWTSPFNNKSD